MPRNLTPDIGASVDFTITSRRWLLELQYSTVLRLYSGQGTISWNGFVWTSSAFDISGPTFDSVGRGNAKAIFSNLDATLSAILLGPQGATGIPASIYYYDNNDAQLLMAGFLDGAEIDTRANINIVTENLTGKSAPRLVAGPPLMNHITPSGTIISWGNERITVERRN